MFEECDVEFDEECAESMKIIKEITEQLNDAEKAGSFGEKLNSAEEEAKQLRIELEKNEETMSIMTTEHQAEIRRITAQAEELKKQVELLMYNEPPAKRKQPTAANEIGASAATGDPETDSGVAQEDQDIPVESDIGGSDGEINLTDSSSDHFTEYADYIF